MQRARLVRILDVSLTTALAGSAALQLWISPPASLIGGLAVHTILVAGFTLPLLVRRSYPTMVCLVVVGATWLQFELGGGLGQPFFAVLIALYSVGAHTNTPRTFVGPVLVLLQVLILDVPRLVAGDPPDEVVPAWFVLMGSWLLGRWIRRRRRETDVLLARAQQAEQEVGALAAQAVADERARIARELHDLVAHSMGVIVIQAQAGQRMLGGDSAAVRAALAAIEATGRNGLSELRRLLGLLTSPDPASTSPQPGLDQLDALLEHVRTTGVPVSLDVEGEPQGLAPGVELAAYRIIQEALTNILKHASHAAATVSLRYGPDAVEVEITDNGPGRTQQDPAGRGLVGMRERVELYGGSLETGPQPGGGFRVHAQLPGGRT